MTCWLQQLSDSRAVCIVFDEAAKRQMRCFRAFNAGRCTYRWTSSAANISSIATQAPRPRPIDASDQNFSSPAGSLSDPSLWLSASISFIKRLVHSSPGSCLIAQSCSCGHWQSICINSPEASLLRAACTPWGAEVGQRQCKSFS